MEIEPQRSLTYTWSAFDVETVVTFTLEQIETGTRLRMEQSGFHADQKHAFRGAESGWAAFFHILEQTLENY